MCLFSIRSFRNFLAAGAAAGILYFLFSHEAEASYRMINCLFLGGMLPFIWGAARFIRGSGTFDLFVYSHRKVWKYGKRHEKEEEENEAIAPGTTETLGSYYDYLSEKKKGPSCLEPLAAGAVFLILSFLGTWIVF